MEGLIEIVTTTTTAYVPRRTLLLPLTLLLPEEIPINVELRATVQLWDGQICAFQERSVDRGL